MSLPRCKAIDESVNIWIDSVNVISADADSSSCRMAFLALRENANRSMPFTDAEVLQFS